MCGFGKVHLGLRYGYPDLRLSYGLRTKSLESGDVWLAPLAQG